ncbi:hypothetical protein GGQ84_000632 [Desulfitispora alkaliphila]|uniref:hypothetical protein n=1 Tax=Desulfitispora alkaliphila TaxID=622674 RepID=UPI003D1CF9B0
MFMRNGNGNYHLGTFGFPSAGWWVVHTVGIAAVYYMGYRAGKKLETCAEDYDEDDDFF